MSECSPQSHLAAKFLHVIAPDLSELRPEGVTELGVWVTCRKCLSTMLIADVAPPRERPPALGIVL